MIIHGNTIGSMVGERDFKGYRTYAECPYCGGKMYPDAEMCQSCRVERNGTFDRIKVDPDRRRRFDLALAAVRHRKKGGQVSGQMEQFWKPAPRQPWHDWRTYSMLIPVLSGTVGACIFMALGFSFTEMGSIAAEVRTPMVIIASFAVAIGSTFGSIGSGIEVFRKRFKKEAEGWDWISLAVSTLTTIAGFGMGFAALLGATTAWSEVAVIYGSIVVGTLAALDSLGDLIELGGLFGSFEGRYESWLEEREQWRRENGQGRGSNLPDLVSRLQALETRWTWPTATLADFKSILVGLNGSAGDLNREGAILLLANECLQPPSDATLVRWLKAVKE